MAFDRDLDAEPIDDLPVRATISVERSNPYGSVPGLPDDELADPGELRRMAFVNDWGPILQLPEPRPRKTFYPTLDEDGHIEGALGSVDFDRLYPRDKARDKASILRDEIRSLEIRREVAIDHLPGPAAFKVQRYLSQGVIDFDHIENEHMQTVVRMDARIGRLRDQISDLRETSERIRARPPKW